MRNEAAQLQKNIIVFGVLFLLSSFFLFGDKKGFILGIKSVFQRPFLWVEVPFHNLSNTTGSFYSYVIAWPEREKKLKTLENQLVEISVDQNQLTILQEENEKMKKLLGASLPVKWKFMDAKVIGTGDILRINRGLNDGIQIGMTVISENILVGKISKVNSQDSLLDLPDRVDYKIPVLVKSNLNKQNEGVTQAKGVLTGLGQNKLEIDRVLQEEKLAKDDYVLTTGEDNWLPNLLIGRIDQVDSNKTAIYQKATVLPLIDYQKLETVFIVIKN